MLRFHRRIRVYRCVRTALAVFVPVLALVTLAPAALTQEGGDDGVLSEVFLEIVDVDVVNLEVQVRDKDGNPIRGLTREDFVVQEDGEPVEVTNFYEVQSAQRVLSAEEAPTAAPETLAELPPDQVLHLAVVVDNDNISPPNRKRALDQLRAELARVVRPGDKVMVGVLDRVPRVEQPFTDDMEAIRSALDRIGQQTSGNVAQLAQKRQLYDLFAQGQQAFGEASVGQALGGGGESRSQPIDYARQALDLLSSYVEQADHTMRRSFAAVDALVSSLSGLPSRKAVLLVSEGLSTNPALEVYEAYVDSFGPLAQEAGVSSPTFESRRYDLSDQLQEITRSAAAERVTFYTLDAFGGRGLVSADQGDLRPLGVAVDLQQQDTLVQLAAATGGTAMLNASNVGDLVAQMATDYSDYYSLGYSSDNSRDGDFHRIRVSVPRIEGARVRHTEGYRAKTVAEEMGDRTLSALILDVARNPLDVRIELGKEQPEKRNRFVVPVLVKVPVNKLALIPSQSAHQGKISIAVAIQDEEGGLSAPQRFEVPVDIPNEQLLNAMSREVGYGVNLMVRGGPSKLAVAVRDEVSAVESTVNLNISVGGG